MTETNPVASMATLKPEMKEWDFERQLDFLETAGLPLPGLQVKIVDENGDELPQDGEAFGELLIRGPWIAAEYYKDPRSTQTFANGWMRTGDVCKITPEGYIRITDRAKDVIKSGGEWISSLDLENTLMGHPSVAEATVVGLKHQKWQERPAAFVVLRADAKATEEELLPFLGDKVAKLVDSGPGGVHRFDPEDRYRQIRQEGRSRCLRRPSDGLKSSILKAARSVILSSQTRMGARKRQEEACSKSFSSWSIGPGNRPSKRVLAMRASSMRPSPRHEVLGRPSSSAAMARRTHGGWFGSPVPNSPGGSPTITATRSSR